MRVEIRASGGAKCPNCNSHPLIFIPAHNRTLDADLRGFFRSHVPWYRPLKRYAMGTARREVLRIAAELREDTLRA